MGCGANIGSVRKVDDERTAWGLLNLKRELGLVAEDVGRVLCCTPYCVLCCVQSVSFELV